jgi:hypothetical protein
LLLLIVMGWSSPFSGAEEHPLKQSETHQNSEGWNKSEIEAQKNNKAVNTPAEPSSNVGPEIRTTAADNKPNRDKQEPQKKWDDWFAAFGPTTWSNWALAVLALWDGLL